MTRVIFACVHNAGRSQIAAALFSALADPARARAVSAGTRPADRVHPEVVEAMRELGIDLSAQRPQKLTDDLVRGAALLITMGCGDECPYVPGLERDDWPLADPKGQPLSRVREIRDEIRSRVQALLDRRGWNKAPLAGTATAIVLAGGRSSRMGRPKALLPFDGGPLISHVIGTLRSLFSDVVIVAAPDQDLPPLPVTLVRDDVAFQGPAAGICHGLRAARSDVCFVTSCDSAFPCVPLIAHLVSRISEHDVVVPCWDGHLQPLHAVYRRSLLPQLERQVERGELRLVDLFERVRTLRVEEDEIRRFDPDGASFFNLNTPEDYAEALRRWRAPGP